MEKSNQWLSQTTSGNLISFGLAFSFGSLITFGFAPFSLWLMPVLSIALMLIFFEHRLNEKLILFAYSFGILLSGSYWVYVSMTLYGGTPIWLATILTALYCGFIASLFIPFGLLFNKLKTQSSGHTLNALNFSCLWLLCEWFRSWFLTGFPRLYIGHSQIDGPLASLAPVFSVYGLSFIIAFIAYSLSSALKEFTAKKTLTKTLITQLFFSAIIIITATQLDPLIHTKNKQETPISVALLQPNLDIFEKWDPDFLPGIKHYLHSATAYSTANLVVWPETALPELFHRAQDELFSYSRELKEREQAVITGIPSFWHDDGYSYFFNSMIGLGEAKGFYHKQKLVPFGEFLPFDKQFRGVIAFFDLPMSEFRRGPKEQPLFKVFGQYKTQPYICYEIVYPQFVSDTAGEQDFLITVSNDAWFGDSIGPAQHFEMARMRALEHGRYLLRSTNTGITAIIGPDGKVIDQLPSFEEGVLTGEIYPRSGLTPVARFGADWPVWVCLSFLMIILLRQYLDKKP